MKKLNLVVVGTMGSNPYAGMAWMHIQMVVGLKRLGHNVFYFETTSTWPYHPGLQTRVNNTEYTIPYLKKIFSEFGIEDDKWAYRCSWSKGKEWIGMSKEKAEDLLLHADAIFNVSGATQFEEDLLKVGRLIYYGTDPVYPEIKYAEGDPFTKRTIDLHQDVITYGENIGNPDCPIPPLPNLKGRTRQPVLMDQWINDSPAREQLTSVGNWKQSNRDLIFKGETYYWSKHHEFLKFIDLPTKTQQTFEMAMNIEGMNKKSGSKDGYEASSHGMETDDYSMLTSHGWKLIDAPSFTTDPWQYRDYIKSSKGEFSFAKDQNIRLRSGWFSERSACYLAAGRPVITQDTGFGNILPTGEGLFSFNSMEEILSAIDKINSNYKKQCSAAREIANEYFSAEKVMNKILIDLGL